MNAKELNEFHDILHAGLKIIRDNGQKDNPEEEQIIRIFTSCNDFKTLMRVGLDDALVETGNGPVDEFAGNAEAEVNRTIKMTVKQLHTALQVAVTLGVDLGAAMVRLGAKFPGAKPN